MSLLGRSLLACIAAACTGPQSAQRPSGASAPAIEREDASVESEPGIRIAVRRVAAAGHGDGAPVLLVHGAGGGAVASFDIGVTGYSLAEDLAKAGHAVYLVDVRGWGNSTRPQAMDQPPEANPPVATSEQVMRDLGSAVGWIRGRDHRAVALVGWATGGHWAGMYAATHPDEISHLVMLNALYGTTGPWSLRAALEDPAHPGQPSPDVALHAPRQ